MELRNAWQGTATTTLNDNKRPKRQVIQSKEFINLLHGGAWQPKFEFCLQQLCRIARRLTEIKCRTKRAFLTLSSKSNHREYDLRLL